jgi:hypothetical protein
MTFFKEKNNPLQLECKLKAVKIICDRWKTQISKVSIAACDTYKWKTIWGRHCLSLVFWWSNLFENYPLFISLKLLTWVVD